ncbi:MAG: hypothetical protein ONB13_07030 [candidate division KSB1 bacterium]|nr:hypothetical protein [candidate division KSB1 bacterium]MDZ7333956.1 hypothetical protein [candidate division KSB1 bacterium]MDZ7356752.1 hypothetical protein [candidate division KSB1 bacterium]MDZ7376357.1 hypothetical protein [candidate division KSB1 bacterium]MDZ7399941.1 hypothetical protein [candidate division KSB1 bacterium]
MKRFLLVWTLILCLTIPLAMLAGCSKKQEPAPEAQQQTEQTEQAPADTVGTVDTTVTAQPQQ